MLVKRGGIIGVKIGSKLIAPGEKIDERFIAVLCKQIALLVNQDYRVILVSSGAVASDPKTWRSKNLRASIGWPRLLSFYCDKFERLKIEVGQLLPTDVYLIEKPAVLKRTASEGLRERRVVFVVNANDPMYDKEIKALEECADNDRLFKHFCLLVKADFAVIGFDQPGVWGPNGKIIHRVSQRRLKQTLGYAKNEEMKTKIRTLVELAAAGIPARLVPGREENFLRRALSGEANFGTSFIA